MKASDLKPDMALMNDEGPDSDILDEIKAELARARQKFPGDNVTFAATVEEVGELATAMFSESRQRVREEAIQVAVMAIRCAEDGDCTFDGWRESKGLDSLTPPTLPEPVPKVPKLLNHDFILGCVHDVDDTEEVVQFCTLVEGNRLHVVYSDCGVGDYDATQMVIYRGPVELPDGTTTTIEPTPELVAAVEGGE